MPVLSKYFAMPFFSSPLQVVGWPWAANQILSSHSGRSSIWNTGEFTHTCFVWVESIYMALNRIWMLLGSIIFTCPAYCSSPLSVKIRLPDHWVICLGNKVKVWSSVFALWMTDHPWVQRNVRHLSYASGCCSLAHWVSPRTLRRKSAGLQVG